MGRPKAGAEYFLRVAFATTTDELWAKKGFEMANKQLQLPVKSPALAADPDELQPMNYVDAEKTITIGGNSFKIEFDKEIGTFSKLDKDHVNILQRMAAQDFTYGGRRIVLMICGLMKSGRKMVLKKSSGRRMM